MHDADVALDFKRGHGDEQRGLIGLAPTPPGRRRAITGLIHMENCQTKVPWTASLIGAKRR